MQIGWEWISVANYVFLAIGWGGGDFFAPPKREQTEKTHREYPQTNQNSRGTLQATVAENRSVNAFGAPAQHRTTGELGDGEIERRI